MVAAGKDTVWDHLNLRMIHDLADQPDTIAIWTQCYPALTAAMSWQQMCRWVEPVTEFSRVEPLLAQGYLDAGRVAAGLSPTEIDCWANVVRRIAGHGWKSIRLACDLLAASDALVGAGGFAATAQLATLLDQIADRDVDLAVSCLESARTTFASLPRETLTAFLALAQTIIARRRGDIWTYFQQGCHLFSVFEANAAARFARLAEAILRHPDSLGISLLDDMASAMTGIDNRHHLQWFDQAQRIAELDVLAAGEFLAAAPQLEDALDDERVETWVDQGIDACRALPAPEQPTACRAFFRLQSIAAGSALAELSERVEFSQVAQLLQLYGQAMAGESVLVRTRGDLAGAGAAIPLENSGVAPALILVPDQVDAFASREENLAAYKARIALDAGRLLFGCAGRDSGPERDHDSAGDSEFADSHLVQTLTLMVDGARIDAITRDEYPGLASSLSRLENHALAPRQSPDNLALRQAFLENLMRASLHGTSTCRWPAEMIRIMATAIGVLRIASRAGASVQQAVDVAHWLYQLAIRIPNIANRACPGPWLDLEDTCIPSFDALPALPALPGSLRHKGPLCPMEDISPPEFRGGPPAAGAPDMPMPPDFDRDAAKDLTKPAKPSALEDADATKIQQTDDLEGESAESNEDGDASQQNRHDETIVWHDYDEWDCHLHGYRTAWCRVGERLTASGSASVYQEILSRRHALVAALRRQFEAMRPEYQRKVKNLHDGHDIDLEQAIRFFVEKKAGTGPVARFYTRRDKIERDVAAAFLFDMSHSTNEKVAPPAETRIIDIERDAAVLIIEAMEAIGDTYGLFAFSGHSRHNVAYYTIKGLDESLCPDVKQRIGGMVPLGATRMGAAIRHTRTLLEQTPCAVKLLFLISDGRPQDKEYGNRDEPAGYGIQDTRQALIEARRAGMVPFVITIDRQGPDYLETMCADLGYEVVADVTSLPGRLATIYRYLAGK